MMKEIKYTLQEAMWTPKNTGKESNSEKEYVSKIRLKYLLSLLLLFLIFGFIGSLLLHMGFL